MTAPERVTVSLPPPFVAEIRGWSREEAGELYPSERVDCLGCGEGFEEDQPVRKVGTRWAHEACTLQQLTDGDADTAWLTLADLIAARPSAFRASDIKAVLHNVALIARRRLS